jgi:hypothetical protein
LIGGLDEVPVDLSALCLAVRQEVQERDPLAVEVADSLETL